MLQTPNASLKTWGFALNTAVELGLTQIVQYMAPYAGFPYSYISKDDYRSALEVAQKSRPEMIPLLSQESCWVSTTKVAACLSIVLLGINLIKNTNMGK
jgi:hypothetical protein